MNTKEKILGIDLGTTNSVIAVLEGANPFIIPDNEGYRTTPSVVGYSSIYNRQLIGRIAKRQSVINPLNTFYSVKRFIGIKYIDMQDEISRVSYQIKCGVDGTIKFFCPILEKEFSPEEISSHILHKLVNDANNYLKNNCRKIILTVPAYFNDSQRIATQDAAKLAGLTVLRIINEPTAAALAYGFDKKKNEILFIFDLGGGTFDVSILETSESLFEVLSTSGDIHLGGDDFDRVISDYLIHKFKLKHGINLNQDKHALQRIIEASEKAKIELSTSELTFINIPYIGKLKNESLNINEKLYRSEFENLTQHLVLKCQTPIKSALISSNIQLENINEVILVGGSSKIPAVRTLIHKMLNLEFRNKVLNESVNPDEVVALGAAVQAGILSGEIQDLILVDVAPLSLGVAIDGGIMARVIQRNSAIPIRKSETFSTVTDFQDSAEIQILQGERDLVSQNKIIGHFTLNGIPKVLKGIPLIRITFDINTDGILSVSACEQSSGIEHSLTITGTGNLSKDEILQIIKDAENNKILDKFFIE
ncbi:MAG: molecular chaperone DnaK, partial [Methanobacterium sp.]